MTHALSSAQHYYAKPSMATSNTVAMLVQRNTAVLSWENMLFTENKATSMLLASFTLSPSWT